MRTARSRTSSENLFDFFMAPSSQELEPPKIQARFTLNYMTPHEFKLHNPTHPDQAVLQE